MGVSRTTESGLIGRLAAEIKRSWQKSAVLGVLMAVLLVVVGLRLAKHLRPEPAQAAGAASGSTGGADRQKPAARKAADGAAEPVDRAPKATSAPARREPVVDRDLFRPNPIYFPPKQKVGPAPRATPVDAEAAKREAERRAVQAQAGALRLQSTIISQIPTAIINGQVLRSGDWIAGFQVVSIGPRSCVVEKKGMRVRLEMPQ